MKNKINSEIKNYSIQKSIRNYGIDLLRIISMINIINLHINLNSGLLSVQIGNSKFKSVWRLEIFSYFAVDCFGLISGVIGYKKYKFSNVIYLWFISLYYSLLRLFLSFDERIKLRDLILSFLPILRRFHWYVNGYFIMYLFLPFLNYGINSLNKIVYRKLIIFYTFLFSFYHIIHILMKTYDYNFLLSGYSAFWLMILYIIGAYFGKYVINNSFYFNSKIKIIYILMYILSSYLSEIKLTQKLFINYLSPTILCQAISLVFFFSRLKIENPLIIKIINFLTPLNFSATLIHGILFSKRNIKIISFFFEKVKEFDNNIFFFKVYAYSILIYIFCIIIDYFRLFIFNVINIKKLCELIDKNIQK